MGKVNTTSIKCPGAYPETYAERHARGWEALRSISDRYLVLGADQNARYGELETIGEILDSVKNQRPDQRFIFSSTRSTT
jgi:hypothetical protein